MIELIVNPTAGGGRAIENAKAVAGRLKERGIDFVMHTTSHPGHATEYARQAAARGSETVLAFGGDGTVHEVAAGLRGTRTALGIIPSGTGNDFIRSAKIPKKWEDALEFVLSHPARPVNSGMMNDHFFMNVCSSGFDVLTLTYADRAKKYVRGLAPYLFGVICAIFRFKASPMHVEIDDQVVMDGKFMICAVGNGRFFGGGIPITPGAELTDGFFDVMVVDNVPNWVIPFYLPSLLRGTLHKKKPAHCFRAKKCVLSSEGMVINMDGETLPMPKANIVLEENTLLLHW